MGGKRFYQKVINPKTTRYASVKGFRNPQPSGARSCINPAVMWFCLKMEIMKRKPSTRMTKKQIDTEEFIDYWIEKYGVPPTYSDIQLKFGIAANTAHYRCRNLRHKMNTNNTEMPVWEMLHGLAHAGKQAKRKTTLNDTYIMIYNNELVQMSATTGVRYPFTLNNDDLMARDWQFRKFNKKSR